MRPIDADKLIETIPTVMDMQDAYLPIHFKEWLIDSAPTVDAVSEWIPCSERLPSNFSEDETVLATTDVDGDRVIAMFALDVKSFYLKGYVSAWMPLPKPYEVKESE